MLQSIYIQNYALIDTLDIVLKKDSLLSQEKPVQVNQSFSELSVYYSDNVQIRK